MSTTPLELASNMLTSDEPLADILLEPNFEYPGADLILRSRDSHHFHVSKSYIINSSPVLNRFIRRTRYSPDNASGKSPLPVVELPESGAILHNLFTFVFPVTPLLPSSTEQTMELLSVAQKYQMVSVLAHIRGSITRQSPPADERDTALHIYSLAQKYGLRPEALQAARSILKYPMGIDDLEDKLDVMPGTSFYGLWEYYEEVRAKLSSNITEFTTSSARVILTGIQCAKFKYSLIPCWIDDYITSIGKAPHLFDLIEFNTALARHLENKPLQHRCTCSSIPKQTIRNFWRALASVVDASFQEVSITHIHLWSQGSSHCRQSRLCLSCEIRRISNPTSIRPRLYLNPWTYPMRILSFDPPTSSTSVSIRQYWPWHLLFLTIYFPFPSLMTANPSMGFPWSNWLKTQNYCIALCRFSTLFPR